MGVQCSRRTKVYIRRWQQLDKVAWYRDNSGAETHPVGQKHPNNFGLYDMSGNVMGVGLGLESPLTTSPSEDPVGPITGSRRVLRGGS